MPRVSIITTVNHNVGDDFVREGILHLLAQVCGPMRVSLIHKHLPVTARPEFSWYHGAGVASRLDRWRPGLGLRAAHRLDRLPLLPWTDRVLGADILVQSGAPVYWATPNAGSCARTEWWEPLIERRWARHAQGRPFLNLAGGTCQPYDSDGTEFAQHPEVLAHIRKFFDLTALTTVRDFLSVKVLHLAGRSAPVLPCTSIFAVNRLNISPKPGRYVALNYMPGAGHYGFGQPIDAAAWESTFVDFARRLAASKRCVLACHNAKELRAARRLLPEIEVFQARDYADYLRFYAEATHGVFNRVHGAFAMGSLGKPALVIGSDSRARMAGLIGLDCRFVSQVGVDDLLAAEAELTRRASDYADEMAALKERVQIAYVELLAKALAGKAAAPAVAA